MKVVSLRFLKMGCCITVLDMISKSGDAGASAVKSTTSACGPSLGWMVVVARVRGDFCDPIGKVFCIMNLINV